MKSSEKSRPPTCPEGSADRSRGGLNLHAGQAFSAPGGACRNGRCRTGAEQTAQPPCSGPAATFRAARRPVLPLLFSLGVDRDHAQRGRARKHQHCDLIVEYQERVNRIRGLPGECGVREGEDGIPPATWRSLFDHSAGGGLIFSLIRLRVASTAALIILPISSPLLISPFDFNFDISSPMRSPIC